MAIIKTSIRRFMVCLGFIVTSSHAIAQDREHSHGGSNEFAVQLLKAVAKGENATQNALVSPYSLSAALGMAYVGARGNTAEELGRVLGLDEDQSTAAQGYRDLATAVEASKDEDGYVFAAANRAWLQQDYAIDPTYLDLTKAAFGAEAKLVDFAADAPGSRRTINDWVAEKTDGKIKELIPDGIVDGNTKLVLTNAAYFLAEWAKVFDKDETRTETEHQFTNRDDKIAFMTQRHAYQIAERDLYDAVEIPYKGDHTSMVVLLPHADHTLEEVLRSLGADEVDTLFQDLDYADRTTIDLRLPKWNIDASYEKMKTTLMDLGVRQAFDEASADFSGISPSAKAEGLHVSQVVHKTFINVYEEGTEATGATAVTLRSRGIPPPAPEFNVTRPFAYFIKDNDTDAILFAGTTVAPTAAK